MTWVLTFLMWFGDGFTVYRIPTTSATACSEARGGVKFAPAAPASTSALGGGAIGNGGGGALAVYCVQEAADSPAVSRYPPTTTTDPPTL